jgi:hypothetical protein
MDRKPRVGSMKFVSEKLISLKYTSCERGGAPLKSEAGEDKKIHLKWSKYHSEGVKISSEVQISCKSGLFSRRSVPGR